MIPGKTYTPKDLIDAAWRRRWWIAATFVLLAAVAFAGAMSLPRRYLSAATIQIVPQPVSDAYVRTAAQTSVADRLSSIGQTALTRTRLETIIKDLDLYSEARQSRVMDMVIEQMRSDITFRSTDRDVFVLGFTAQDPHVAQAVATRLTSLFIGENARDREQRAEATTSFLDAQLADARKKLDEQERQLEVYRTKFSGELPSQLSLNVQELNNTQLNLRSLGDTVSRDQDQRLFLQRQLELAQASAAGSAPGAGEAPSQQTAGGADALETARAALKALELRLTPEHPDVQRKRRDIAKLEQQAREQGATSGASPSAAPGVRRDARSAELQGQIDMLDRRIAANQAEMRRLRGVVDNYTRRIDSAPVREAEMATLTRDYEETKRLYSSLMTKQQDASMTAQLETKSIGDRFRVIEAARLPEKSSGKSRTSAFAIGLLAALGIALSLAAVVEYRDTSLRTEDDIKVSLHLPVLASIPNLENPAQGRS